MPVKARVAQGYSVRTGIFWWWRFIENSHGARDSRKHKWVYIPAPPSNFLLLVSEYLAKEISTSILVQCTTFLRIRKKLNSLFLFYMHFNEQVNYNQGRKCTESMVYISHYILFLSWIISQISIKQLDLIFTGVRKCKVQKIKPLIPTKSKSIPPCVSMTRDI